VFDLELSASGIVILRPGRAPQHMAWERVSQWELEERRDHLLLTLRGDGAVTPLVVRGWSPQDLAAVMQEMTGSASTSAEAADADVPPDTEAELRTSPGQEPKPADLASEPAAAHGASLLWRRLRSQPPWKAVVTVGLLVALATAVTLVLLQSAGVISWSFLGPTA
jgi:hypothetical protein